jgi:hypothetical protein
VVRRFILTETIFSGRSDIGNDSGRGKGWRGGRSRRGAVGQGDVHSVHTGRQPRDDRGGRDVTVLLIR